MVHCEFSMCKGLRQNNCVTMRKCAYVTQTRKKTETRKKTREHCRLSHRMKMKPPTCEVVTRKEKNPVFAKAVIRTIMEKKLNKLTDLPRAFLKDFHHNDLLSDATPEKTSSPSELSPGSLRDYEEAHFQGKSPIILLHKLREKDNTVMFQVSFKSPAQFDNYVNLDPNINSADCFYQSLFSVGLLPAKIGKQNAKNVNKNGKGVIPDKIMKYIQKVFKLRGKETITYEIGPVPHFQNNLTAINLITRTFRIKLSEGCATLFCVYYNQNTGGHCIVVYKFKNKLIFFDPQGKGTHPDDAIRSESLLTVLKTRGISNVSQFGFFEMKNLKKPKFADNFDCPIPYALK